MAQVTAVQLAKIAGGKPDMSNIASVITALDAYGKSAGLDRPHRLAHFIAQLAHESGGFRYDREVWGPTPAQARYDTRTDLGNTKAADGDGKKNAGRGPIQLTGGANIAAFEAWALDEGLNPPDFTANPDMINTDPWEGLSAIFYWARGNPTGRSLNPLADANDIEQITKKINGGLNGFDDRVRYYTRAALVLIGYGPTEVVEFQRWAQAKGLLPEGVEQLDGDPGPKTRAALHQALAADSPNTETKAGPVTETVEKPIPVTPAGADKRAGTWWTGLTGMASSTFLAFANLDTTGKLLIGGVAVLAFAFFIWRGEIIVRRIKTLVAEIGRG